MNFSQQNRIYSIHLSATVIVTYFQANVIHRTWFWYWRDSISIEWFDV